MLLSAIQRQAPLFLRRGRGGAKVAPASPSLSPTTTTRVNKAPRKDNVRFLLITPAIALYCNCLIHSCSMIKPHDSSTTPPSSGLAHTHCPLPRAIAASGTPLRSTLLPSHSPRHRVYIWARHLHRERSPNPSASAAGRRSLPKHAASVIRDKTAWPSTSTVALSLTHTRMFASCLARALVHCIC